MATSGVRVNKRIQLALFTVPISVHDASTYSGCVTRIFAVKVPFLALAANVQNWEGPHIDVSADNRAIDWWYTQVISQTPASGKVSDRALTGIPPSIEIVLKHGNTFQFGASNTPLYPVEINGFDQDGLPFKQTIIFNRSSVVSAKGVTTGTWGNKEIVFTASRNPHKKFTIELNTPAATGTVVVESESHFLTGCGGTKVTDSPYFDKLVANGRPLTDAEVILYKKTGWRVSIPAGPSSVDLVISGKPVKFKGAGYKDSNWGPNAMNDFVRSWYVLIAQVGPWSFVTFSGTPSTGTNYINSAHLSYRGKFVTSQCNIIGERTTDISIITPSGEVTESNVVAPTAFDVTFVLPNSKKVSFHATNIAANPSVGVYHRWVAKYTGGAPGEHYEAYGITEWMNAGNVSHWPAF
ncbi:hypothetical protein D9615_002006 [Tricholomella constricta]|uniref:AsqO/PenF-like C-terminal domain-containing protein n=1 Tax=Tricholomella constricta TaxID=117010 RepID=A0A8H5HNW1_9AGAR|nr:hypothetical protein D9615_002006 [Tricholomella constricta]